MTTYFPKPLDKQVSALSDSVSQTQDGLAIVANGNTHAAISSGQFVYVKNHGTLAEGLYKATASISANGSLSTSNLTADGTGGLNDLQSQVTSLNSKILRITKQVTLNENGEWSSWANDEGYPTYSLISADYDDGWNAVTVIHEKYTFWHIKITGLANTTVTIGLVILKI